MDDVSIIELNQYLAPGTGFSLIVSMSRGSKIAYFSDHGATQDPRLLAKQGIGILITPQLVAKVHQPGAIPQISIVACIPESETPDYPNRCAEDPTILKEALQTALAKIKHTLKYAN